MTSVRAHNSKGKNKCRKVSTYNLKIDQVIVSALSKTAKIHHGQLKREVEQSIGVDITSKVFTNHLKKMQSENYLLREDTGERTTRVFYSLTEKAKELRDLRILSMDPERSLFLQKYANLFFRAVIDGTQYAGDDLEYILNEIHAIKEELQIESIKKSIPRIVGDIPEVILDEAPDLTTVEERRLPISVTICYKPTQSGVKIFESTSYRENLVNSIRMEYTVYLYNLPGVSVEDLSEKYYTFKPEVEDCKAAIDLLLKRNLILPVMNFQDTTRFIVADPVLMEFLTDFCRLNEMEHEFNNEKWQFLRPTFIEEQSRRIWYSDETMSERFFNIRELQRHESRTIVTESPGIHDELMKISQKFEKTRSIYINELIRKYRSIFEKYHFLFELVRLVSPLFFQAIAN
jgi:DNA-binding HxlR family transcriptional regulator